MFIHSGNLQKKSCYTFQHQELCLADKGFSCFLCSHIRGSTDFKEKLVVLNPISASNEFKFHAFMKLGENMNGRKLFFALAATSGENENFPFSRGAPSAVRFSHSAGWLSKGALGILFDGKAQSLQTGLPIEVFLQYS